MSLIKECIVCGNRVSFRKMSHGKYVCFDVKTNNRHIHSKAEIDKARKKNGKDQKIVEAKKDSNLKIKDTKKIKEDDLNQSEELESYREINSKEIFKKDTVESLRKEIDLEITDKKINKPIIYIAIATLAVIVLVFMNG